MRLLKRNIFIAVALLFCAVSLFARETGGDSVPVRHPSCWRLIAPLGLHKAAEFDTLPYNYQRQAIPSMVSDAYATTGHLGANPIQQFVCP